MRVNPNSLPNVDAKRGADEIQQQHEISDLDELWYDDLARDRYDFERGEIEVPAPMAPDVAAATLSGVTSTMSLLAKQCTKLDLDEPIDRTAKTKIHSTISKIIDDLPELKRAAPIDQDDARSRAFVEAVHKTLEAIDDFAIACDYPWWKFEPVQTALYGVVKSDETKRALGREIFDDRLFESAPHDVVAAERAGRVEDARAHLDDLRLSASEEHQPYYFVRARILEIELALETGYTRPAEHVLEHTREVLSKKLDTRPELLTPDPRDPVSQPLRMDDVEAQLKALETKIEDPPPVEALDHRTLIDTGLSQVPADLKVLQAKLKALAEHRYAKMSEVVQLRRLGRKVGRMDSESPKAKEYLEQSEKLESEIRSTDPELQELRLKAYEKMVAFREDLVAGGLSKLSRKHAEKLSQTVSMWDGIPEHDRPRLRAGLVDLLRLSGGRGIGQLLDIRATERSDTPFAHPGTIDLHKSLADTTLFHEYGHHLEYCIAGLREAGVKFLQERAGTTEPKSFREIYGDDTIEADHHGYEFDGVSDYAGRVYEGSGSTEVTSVGLEYFTDPEAMLHLFTVDPDHFGFVLGALQQ